MLRLRRSPCVRRSPFRLASTGALSSLLIAGSPHSTTWVGEREGYRDNRSHMEYTSWEKDNKSSTEERSTRRWGADRPCRFHRANALGRRVPSRVLPLDGATCYIEFLDGLLIVRTRV